MKYFLVYSQDQDIWVSDLKYPPTCALAFNTGSSICTKWVLEKHQVWELESQFLLTQVALIVFW